ncbi:uncharacterized protein LOC100120213 isoform X2 [Nasonia vitripennis]|uniref:Uncharacterized protein n=1 Tax=Nasonia vitripennis TaxID=7425 RepID=A0A7M7QV41_NASVI|nr:uncharacterized protein LOC100120213 [Nasonia vitripennis]XP_032455025.1 uncharacterized protein LOC100120213 isoform X2 [Nasonia vitripennis]
MGSSRPTDRSIGEATFLPQWMKGKLDTRFDYTESTFSPPADDTFFYIRYPKSSSQDASANSNAGNKEGFRPLSEIIGGVDSSKPEATASSGKLLAGKSGTEYKDAKNIDFSKHPLPCQAFIPFTADKANEPKIIIANKPKVKHLSADDEFRNDNAAECGRSIVNVANQIMSSKFGKSNSSDASSATQHQVDDAAAQQKKVSRSLPATPLASPSGTPDSSPKTRRRAYGNRFFTPAFIPDSSGEYQQQQSQRYKNGWLLSSILGQSRELIAPKIEEEDEQLGQEPIPSRALSRKKSISSQNLTYLGKEDKKQETTKSHILMQAKPSELREMNFWSPTSM